MLSGWLKKIRLQTDALLACIAMGLVLLLIVPLPPLLLDSLLSLSIVFSVITLLLTLYIEDALEFSSFPSLLLFLTLFRLGLNIASTRMILTRGEGGDIIATFGAFVIQGNTAVGLILFLLLTIINFIVVTKGAGRIAEVAARFTLEALPGKQLAIDGELNAGMLNQGEAKKARERVSQEAEFYGAMDGASKFVRGDAIAGLVITGVNILGGIIVGFFFKGYSWEKCWQIFIRLTVGDGLVSQIPALLISLGAGMMVTRASKGSLGEALTREMFHNSKVIGISGVILLILGFLPGMPFFVMSPISAAFLIYAYAQRKMKKKEPSPPSSRQEEIPHQVFPVEILLGYTLSRQAESFYAILGQMRAQVGAHLGIRIPSIRMSDHPSLSATGWEVKIRGISVAKGRADEISVLRHICTRLLFKHAFELINRQDVAEMVQKVKQSDAAVVEELIPKKLALGELLKILQNLLREEIPIRDLETILEMVADFASQEEKNLDRWTEKIRLVLSKGFFEGFFGDNRTAYVITLDPKIEQLIYQTRLDPKAVDLLGAILLKMDQNASKMEGIRPLVMTTSTFRPQLKRLIEKYIPHLPVLAYSEIPQDIDVKTLRVITYGELA